MLIKLKVTLSGIRIWYYDNRRHNNHGPAGIWGTRTSEWYNHGKLHRLDGPAVVSVTVQYWYVNHLRHRLDGPAVEYTDGYKEWWVNGVEHSYLEYLVVMETPRITVC